MKNNKQEWYIFILLIFVFILYYPSIFCELTNWDDVGAVIENPIIRSLSLPYLKRIFTEVYYWNYQPLLNLSYAIEYYFFGVNSKIIHLDNILLFLINIFLVYKFIHLLSGNNTVALVATILFAVHPTRVEPVIWATTRSYVLYLSFYLLSLIEYIKYLNKSRGNGTIFQTSKNYFLSIVLFLLACLCKSSAISLIFPLILIDFLLRREVNRRYFIDKIPFIIISIAIGLIAIWSAKELDNTSAFNFGERTQIAGYAILFYLSKFFLPMNLSVFYPYPYHPGELPLYYWIFPCIILILGYFIYTMKHRRKIVFGFGFFLFSVALMLQFFAVGGCFAADRYGYIPCIGLFYMAGEGYNYFEQKVKGSKWGGKILILLFLAIALYLSSLTYSRIKVWKNSITLLTDVIEQYPNKVPLAYNNRGLGKRDKGDTDGALKDFDKAISLNSNYDMAYSNRANLKIDRKNYSGALEDLNKSINIKPTDYAYNNRGRINLILGHYEEALSDFNYAAQKADINLYQILFSRGFVYLQLKRYQQAIDDFTKAIDLNPSFGKAFFNRGNTKFLMNDIDGACKDWIQAKRFGDQRASQALSEKCYKKVE